MENPLLAQVHGKGSDEIRSYGLYHSLGSINVP